MKSSEILGALRDLVDKISSSEETTPVVNQFPVDTTKRFVTINVNTESPEASKTSNEPPLDTMVPPLQQKMELLKRAVDIDNVFDGTSVDKTTNGQDDYKQEINSITKNAGIPTAAIMALTDEEPLDD
jgi:hypothetical protein